MTAVLVVLVVLGGLLTTTRWWDVDHDRRGAPLVVRAQALVPLVGPAAAGALAVGLVTGAGLLAVLAGALLAVHVVLALPAWWAVAPDERRATAEGDEVVVLAVNTWYGRADPAATASLLRRVRPDVVALVEVSPAGLSRLEAAGLADGLPHRVGRAADGGVGTVVLSRWPLSVPAVLGPLGRLPLEGTAAPAPGQDPSSDNPLVEVAVPGRAPLVVRAVHPYYPATDDVGAWRRQLGALDRWAREHVAARPGPLVVLGDLNATADHACLRRLLAPGGPLRLAAHEVGGGRRPTWPSPGRWPGLPGLHGLLAIDHVLVHGVHVVAAGTAPVAGTDHAAAWARLRLPAA